MRTIERSSAFKRDFKRVKATPHHAREVDGLVLAAAKLLAADQPLPEGRPRAFWRLGRIPRVPPQAGFVAGLPEIGR